ncbi:MAG TPA: DUF5990 family protein [Mucilaginibacter sp.]
MPLQLHITLQTPPAGVAFSLQKGHGHDFEIEQVQMSNGCDLHFDLEINVKDGENLSFTGPYVEGPTGGKFVYIRVGILAGQETGYERRIKIPLSGITQEMIAKAAKGIETIIPGTAKDGTPTCATVKPFAGWSVIK